MDLPGITHEYGPWSPARFIPVPFRDGMAPAFYVATSRICRGIHDWRCTQGQTQTYGPLVLEGADSSALQACDNCGRIQPAPASGEAPVCLFCTDMATVQHLGDGPGAVAAVAAAAALHGAAATIRHAKAADPHGYLALLDETGDSLRSVLEDAAWAIKQDSARAGHTGYGKLVQIARQVLANARSFAELEDASVKPARQGETCSGSEST